MKRVSTRIVGIAVCALVLSINIAHAQTQTSNTDETVRAQARTTEFESSAVLAQARPYRRAGFSLMPASRHATPSGSAFTITPMASGPQPVTGSGSLGRLPKWAGFTGSNSVIGDSTIFEDKFGMVGIGTDSPTSRLTVAGMIQSLGGGFKFPDGTIQTTSATGALSSIAHDSTLTGNGTSGQPLGVAVPLVLEATSNSSTLTAVNIGVGLALDARGGADQTAFASAAIRAVGGDTLSGFGGRGL
jgi:hypothetical protein